MTDDDLPVVRDIYAEGIATRNATFETEVPDVATMATKWLPGHRWVAEADVDGVTRVVGWTAISPVSERACYAGVGETRCTSPSRPAVAAWARRCSGARSTRPTPAACGRCRPRCSPRTEPPSRCTTRPATPPSQSASRIAQLDGVWRDTVLLERRKDD